MIKFVSILISVLSLNFMVSYTAAQPEGIGVEFSKKAIGVESGQPVFSKDTKVLISNPTKDKIKLYLNEDEKEIDTNKIELNELAEGTYTLVVVSKKEESIFGFTIQ